MVVYKYVSVSYDDIYTDQTYSYKTDIATIEVGDRVLVDRNGEEVYGIVESIGSYTRETAPYPVDKTKDIIAVVGHDFHNSKDYELMNTKLLDYKHLLLLILLLIYQLISIKLLVMLNFQ